MIKNTIMQQQKESKPSSNTTMEIPSPKPKLKLTTVLFESRRVIKSQPGHRGFLGLGLAFLLPLSVAVVVSQNNFLAVDPSANTLSDDDAYQLFTAPATATLLLKLAYGLFILFATLFAAGSVTFAAFHAFHGQPVEAKHALKSLSASFFPLLATAVLAHAIVLAILAASATLCAAAIGAAWLLGFQIDLGSPYFLAFAITNVVFLTAVTTYLHVTWALSSVVVVVESTWGFEALNRSSSLLKGKRYLTFVLSLVFGALYGVLGWKTSYTNILSTEKNFGSIMVVFVTQVMVIACLRTMVMLYEIVATTVLYVYCKAIHDAENFGDQYVGLFADDEKVNNGVVYVNKPKVDGYYYEV